MSYIVIAFILGSLAEKERKAVVQETACPECIVRETLAFGRPSEFQLIKTSLTFGPVFFTPLVSQKIIPSLKKTKMGKTFQVGAGRPLPLGTHKRDNGINFAVFSRHANRVWLELFDNPRAKAPSTVIELPSGKHRTGDIWHVWVKGIAHGQTYAFRMDGPYLPEQGHRFNRNKLLLDPYATALVGTARWDFACARGFDAHSPLKDLSYSTADDALWMAKCLVIDNRFDWQGDRPLRHLWSNTIIYETHVRGLTIHPSSGVKNPGTFLGVIEKIPYFKELGITAVELMPVQEFNENELELTNPLTGERLQNYWGYNTVSFFAPKESYSCGKQPGCQVSEFKTMVKELHRAGIEVILDIVLNHTAEGNEVGPTLSFRGIENSIYYMLEGNRRFYRDYSGCGNTLNCNHPIVRDYILDCLRYWVVEMHVDGFRFDLASVLGRDENGNMLPNPPLLERIAEDPILREVKLIAEAWDAGGAYQVGSFPGQPWSEWNGCYRDDVRRFWRGDPGMVGALASRMCGSADLYQRSGKEPLNSINFITCHDGLTLNDVVSYKDKHNGGNSEDNRDGTSEDFSDNYGFEGQTNNSAIEVVRLRQLKNMLATLLISRGVPMLLGGDEFRRTQHGNNNAYCQDNEVSWYDWELLLRNHELFRFTRQIIAFRKAHDVLRAERFYTDRDVHWFNHDGGHPNWGASSQTLGCLIYPENDKGDITSHAICLLFNTGGFETEFMLPAAPGDGRWYLAVNTAKLTPDDIRETGNEKMLDVQTSYVLQPGSMVILVAREGPL
jgi:isoamylase